jgi:NTE family protein
VHAPGNEGRVKGVLDHRLDLYALKREFERINELIDVGSALADLGFLARARRALLPLPIVDRHQARDAPVFEPLTPAPIPALRAKRIAVIGSGGGGACAGLVGVARAFEEAGVRPEVIVACSGSAIWASMWAAGLTSDEMAEFSLSWRGEDYLDIQWAKLPRFALSALRGFSGLAKGEAIEHLFNQRVLGLRAGELEIPLTTIVYNMDLGRVEYFGTRTTPGVTIGELVRIAIALPLFVEAVRVNGHLYVDGGIIELIPAEPVIADGGFDHVFALNFMLPAGLEPADISGWEKQRAGILRASRQLQQGYHLEFARRARDRLGDKLILVDPVDYDLLRGVSFYDLFIDRSRWPHIMRQGYDAMRSALDRFRDAS